MTMPAKTNAQGFSESVTTLVKTLRSEAPDCVAAGVVDMSTGMLLAYETVDSHPSEVLDLLAGATLDLFQGRTVVMVVMVVLVLVAPRCSSSPGVP